MALAMWTGFAVPSVEIWRFTGGDFVAQHANFVMRPLRNISCAGAAKIASQKMAKASKER
jgi:hypothetical protein